MYVILLFFFSAMAIAESSSVPGYGEDRGSIAAPTYANTGAGAMGAAGPYQRSQQRTQL